MIAIEVDSLDIVKILAAAGADLNKTVVHYHLTLFFCVIMKSFLVK